ncbi:MAG: GHKL domain-containing protein [Lachnospiraceae bacterium]|nr:GHKL domain-containing protein [Lachnospiraceae bacterium]
MNLMTEFIMLTTEAISVMLWLYIWNDRKFQTSRSEIGFIIVYVVYYFYINLNNNFFIENIFPAVCIFVWSIIKFKDKVFAVVLKFLSSMVCLGMVQLIFLELSYWYFGSENIESLRVVYIVASMLSIITSVLIYMVRQNGIRVITKPDKKMIVALLYVCLVMSFIKYDYNRNDETYGYMYITLYIFLVTFMFYIVRDLNIKHKMEQRNLEARLSQQYGEVYKGLLEEMRRKQHDYSNQISAIYSMSYVDETWNAVKENQRRYIEQLSKKDDLDKLLLNCENSILAGYLYTQCNEARQKGINMDINVSWRDNCNVMLINEVIESLGIMINNAVEHLECQYINSRNIKVNVMGIADKISIQVSNPCEYQSYNTIQKMFDNGYSTKGENRGIGLCSLRKIVEKYEGELMAENTINENINWFQISVKI